MPQPNNTTTFCSVAVLVWWNQQQKLTMSSLNSNWVNISYWQGYNSAVIFLQRVQMTPTLPPYNLPIYNIRSYILLGEIHWKQPSNHHLCVKALYAWNLFHQNLSCLSCYFESEIEWILNLFYDLALHIERGKSDINWQQRIYSTLCKSMLITNWSVQNNIQPDSNGGDNFYWMNSTNQMSYLKS